MTIVADENIEQQIVDRLRADGHEVLYVAEFFERTTAMQGTTLATIDRLREYRSVLIAAAVTGQLDIREHERKIEALA